ncbi:NUDIX hydrolase [Tengunoibacter tsumagoiensis]|uniref:Nudix hydrolase domain-containing protein n=1 Tax=Tengunoibacter tsumagoiensis TaxID=2014871 RepID=A0A402A7S9_9CHLR|nr:NUDIX hydrolase [Tengunoibacter tsumagoiensis]GCE15203.1 hypothetical protein KTT_50620 [Tengunoibacter tsumagoiensis]
MNTSSSISEHPEETHTELLSYVQRSSFLHQRDVTWGGAQLRITSYANQELPPQAKDYVTSVRCLVLRENEVLAIQDPHSYHLLPGGHCEAGETFEQTLRRELQEESGWTVQTPYLIGFRHLLQAYPYPPYPYPHNLHLIYCALADSYHPDMREVDGYELGAAFYPINQLEALALGPEDRAYLPLALACLEGRTSQERR